ncbi:hypothetical protein DRB17_18605 [Ferruginivarius sediminum]|uniref:Uncharacterized protein n=2 Tax=Ferruginivarius sediminum TaxID=2661937 RepID=A0A369T4U9_9PROT|nr:hypothetical protein DRB17_18605 [Ferruginivarius sediminum]
MPRQKGKVTLYIREALRDAEEPLTTRELAYIVMHRRGMDTTDNKEVRNMAQRTARQLPDLRAKGRVRSEVGPKREMLWWLA